MTFESFERAARAAFDEIPPAYRKGVHGLVVRREACPHPRFPDVFTLGLCDTDAYPSDWGGPETIRSVVVLYWGSFRELARRDPGFDWEEQIWETLTHELRHHLESLADEDGLEDVDRAMEEDFKRSEGLDFDPYYYRLGDRIAPDTYAVEDRVFIEQTWRERDFLAADELRFRWVGRTWAVPRPAELGDVHFVWVSEGPPAPPEIELVLVRSRSWLEDAKRLFGGSRPRVLESQAGARAVG